MTEQIQEQMKKLMSEGKASIHMLKMMYKTIDNLKDVNHGMKEDTTYVPPVFPTKKGIRKMEIAKEALYDNVKNDLSKIQKMFLNVNEEISEIQKLQYKIVMNKRRQREYECKSKEYKRQRKEDVLASREKKNELNKLDTVSINDLENVMYNDDSDEFNEFDEVDMS